jgi:Fe-S cluster assembly protein SufD
MNLKSIIKENQSIVIKENCELVIKKSNCDISFLKNVNKVYISELVDSKISFVIASDISILFFHKDGNSKSNIKIKLTKHNAHATIREIALTTKDHQYEKNIELIHKHKSTFSDFKFFGFATNNSKIKISALSIVKKGMSKSEAHQMINIITEKNAHGEGQPGLLIDDFDVKASHGNSIGQISNKEVYYLQTKGIDKSLAQ